MPEKISTHIGRRLLQARQNRGLTQAEVAKRAGTNTNYYAKLERGEAIPSLKMLEKVIKALGIKSSDVLPF
jgi:transcriptional regulator with XRE-family HTH domain